MGLRCAQSLCVLRVVALGLAAGWWMGCSLCKWLELGDASRQSKLTMCRMIFWPARSRVVSQLPSRPVSYTGTVFYVVLPQKCSILRREPVPTFPVVLHMSIVLGWWCGQDRKIPVVSADLGSAIANKAGKSRYDAGHSR